MSRTEAFAKALNEIGPDAIVGENQQKSNRFYVGRRVQGEWVSFGAGSTWEEALLNHKTKKA